MLKRAGIKAHYEEEILRNLHHYSIPRFIKKVEFEGAYGCILEYKNGRTFEDIIYLDKYLFSKTEIYKVGAQIIEIIKYLHEQGVVHRDIRVPNTLYDKGKVYLVDFGLARWVNNEKYKEDMDFAFLGDFLLHLYYSSFKGLVVKKCPWYEELELTNNELFFIKRLMGIEERYKNISEVEKDFKIVTDTVL